VLDRSDVVEAVADPAGMWGFPHEAAEAMVVTGPPAAMAEHLAALGEAGVERVAVTAVGTWSRQAELLAEAARMLDGVRCPPGASAAGRRKRALDPLEDA
jgi:hypothetical protein